MFNPAAADKMEQKIEQAKLDAAKLIAVAEYAVDACPQLELDAKQVANFAVNNMNTIELDHSNIDKAFASKEVQDIINNKNFCKAFELSNEFNFKKPVTWDKKTPIKIEIDKPAVKTVKIEISP